MRRRIAVGLAASFVATAAYAALSWTEYARDPQHSAVAGRSAQTIEAIHWQAPVDLDPQYVANDLFIHYGTPLVTSRNTVVFPVKTGATDGFRVDARNGRTGAQLWSFATDYVLPPHDWTPSCGVCLGAGDRVVVPASGGTLLVLAKPDKARTAPVVPTRIAFYGIENYVGATKDALDQNVFICSPIVRDAKGTLYFTFRVGAAAPLSLTSGIARIPLKGAASWTKASDAAAAASDTVAAMNAAPALSRDGRTLYVAVNVSDGGDLCALDAKTLARKASIHMMDPQHPADAAIVHGDSTASPCVGPDGDVYFGVIESRSSFNYGRGWLLHFDAKLTSTKLPGSFGWDDTASVVPRGAVPSYKGKSKYLLLTKYNDYAEVGGTGVNKIAVLDPNVGVTDPRTNVGVMQEILTIAGPTPDAGNRDAAHPDAVREWCINTAAIDVRGRAALVNNEDGVLYRWDFRKNLLTQSVVLTPGVGEAYTPTVIGPDGTVYAINNATLFAVGKKPK